MGDDRLACASCEESIKTPNQAYFGDPATHYEGKPLCESCYYDSDPVATILYGRNEEPRHITMARNETEGEYRAGWLSTDPWRGYYELSSEKYSRIFSDAILAYHESEAMLKELNDRVMAEFDEKGIEYVRAFTRTSNVFSTGYDIWVRKEPEQILTAHLILQRIKKDVDFNNPLYSTGIVMDREAFEKLQTMLSGKYQIENDHELMNLVAEKGEELLGYVKEMYEGERHGH